MTAEGAALVAALADPAMVVDDAGSVVATNDAAANAGRSADDVTGGIALDLAGGGRLLVWPEAATLGDEEIAREKARILEHLAPGVAHDLINQVGGIRSFLQVIAEFDEHDRRLLEETATKALDTVTAFQELVRTRSTGPDDVAPAELVGRALAISAHPLQEVHVTVDVSDDLPEVHAEPGELRQAVLALMVNALDALGWPAARGELRVTARRTPSGVEIAVEDDAAPVPVAAVPRLFDPRPPRDSGRAPLDLATARYLARLAGGDVRAEIGGERGNRFVLELPAGPGATSRVGGAAPGQRPEPAREGPPAAAGVDAAPAILVCDDDGSIRTLIVRVLRRDGTDAVGAEDGDAALRVLAERPVTLVVTDHHLGAMSGIELYRRAVELHPGLRGRFVLVSGDAGDAELVAFAREHGLPVVEKPFDVGDLARLVRLLAAG